MTYDLLLSLKHLSDRSVSIPFLSGHIVRHYPKENLQCLYHMYTLRNFQQSNDSLPDRLAQIHTLLQSPEFPSSHRFYPIDRSDHASV